MTHRQWLLHQRVKAHAAWIRDVAAQEFQRRPIGWSVLIRLPQTFGREMSLLPETVVVTNHGDQWLYTQGWTPTKKGQTAPKPRPLP